jgi:hypothetical protein
LEKEEFKKSENEINKAENHNKSRVKIGIKMDLINQDEDEDLEVTEEALTFHSNVRENIVSILIIVRSDSYRIKVNLDELKWVIGTSESKKEKYRGVRRGRMWIKWLLILRTTFH